jgi:translation elongation factor EF-4
MEPCEDGEADLVRLDVHVNGVMAPALARIVIREDALRVGQHLVETLKKHIERQSFDVSLQAVLGSKVIAKARVAPYRKQWVAVIRRVSRNC